MGRLGRLGILAVLLAGTLNVAALALPGRASACSCMPGGPERIGIFANEAGIVVFVGTVVSMSNVQDGAGHTTGELLIQHVYKGAVPSARVRVSGGGGGDCTMSLEAGQRMITAASFENGAMQPGLCMPFGDPDSAQGQALIKAAIVAYGPGAAPPSAQESPPPASAPDPWLPIILAAVVLVVVALFGLVAVVSKRGRTAG